MFRVQLMATDETLLNDHMKEKHSKPDEVEQQITIETLNYKFGQTFKEKSKKCSDCLECITDFDKKRCNFTKKAIQFFE